MENWSVYILRNERNALYTGVTNRLGRRLAEHRNKLARGAKFTRACQSLDLVYHCAVGPRSLALRIESKIKRLQKPQKELLVASAPELHRLLELLGLPAAAVGPTPSN
ncbi:MAG TPA: GIY-YIG nuclease family protein [Desulfuromonadales bacterium]|nr:GIY-YIG nuclease family protein [Desulfuromonadales bacterium]